MYVIHHRQHVSRPDEGEGWIADIIEGGGFIDIIEGNEACRGVGQEALILRVFLRSQELGDLMRLMQH